MKKTLILITIFSLPVQACDIYSYYDKENREILIAASGDPSECNLEFQHDYLLKELNNDCDNIENIMDYFNISKENAIYACSKIKKRENSDSLFDLFLPIN